MNSVASLVAAGVFEPAARRIVEAQPRATPRELLDALATHLAETDNMAIAVWRLQHRVSPHRARRDTAERRHRYGQQAEEQVNYLPPGYEDLIEH